MLQRPNDYSSIQCLLQDNKNDYHPEYLNRYNKPLQSMRRHLPSSFSVKNLVNFLPNESLDFHWDSS